MSDDRLIPPPRGSVAGRPGLPAEHGDAPPPGLADGYYPAFEPESGGLDLRRYLYAILRYKWLVILAALIGVGGAFAAWRTIQVAYTAEGNLWIEIQDQQGMGDVAPVRAATLLE